MKNIFKKIALLSAAILTLSACANLLPNLSRRIRSTSSEISESFDGGMSSGYPSSTRYRDSSSGGRSSSYRYDYKEGDTFRMEGMRGNYQCSLYIQQSCDYWVYNERTGEVDKIINYSFSSENDLNPSFKLTEDNRMLRMSFIPVKPGIYENHITVTTEHGGTHKVFSRVLVDSNTYDSDIHIDYPFEFICSPDSVNTFYAHAYNNQTGQDIYFKKTNPIEIVSTDETMVKFNRASIYENRAEAIADIQTFDEGKCSIELKLNFNDGRSFNIVVFVIIRPDIWIKTNPEMVYIPYNSSALAEIEVVQYDNKTGREYPANIDFDKCEFYCYNFKYEIVEFAEDKITVRFYNERSDYGDFEAYLWTDKGYYLNIGIGIMSQQAYESQRWINIDFNYIRYQTECTMRFTLGSYTGNKIIRSIKFVSKNKIIPDFVANNINATYYDYKFTPTSYGEEEVNIVVTEDNGNVVETNWGFYIEP